MCFFHHDRWLSDTVFDNVKSTDICGQNRWCAKLYLPGPTYIYLQALCFSLVSTQQWCLWRLPRHLKVVNTRELPGALPPGPPPGLCPWTPHRETLCSLPSLRSNGSYIMAAPIFTTLLRPCSINRCNQRVICGTGQRSGLEGFENIVNIFKSVTVM